MKALKLFKEYIGPELRLHAIKGDIEKTGWEEVEIGSVVDDSRKVGKDSVFFAIKGTQTDGHEHLEDVVRREPAAIVVEDISRVPSEYRGLLFETESTRKIFAKVCYKFADSPSDGWLNVAVTGTNGKTTVTHMIEHILNEQGLLTGVIGTVDHHVGATKWATQLTTPGSAELTARLQAFARLGTKAMAMEVSSHALSQYRADGVPFNVAVFTNLTRDHLDFHYDMEEYYQAKRRLFSELIPDVRVPKGAAINVEDEYGRKLANSLKIPTLTFGIAEADVVYEIVSQGFSGTELALDIKGEKETLKLAIPSKHNVQNAIAAVAACLLLGMDRAKTLKAISTFPGVKGRLEAVPNSKNVNVFVDYAHTDDALKSVLTSLKLIRDNQKQKAKIITVFGCGGDRDRGKRPLMFNAAFSLSDTVIVTSDNPRTEDPNGILDDILRKLKPEDLNKRVFREIDRKKAIVQALNQASPGDVVLIAGKGHEEYQILGTQKVHFSDCEVVKECLG